MIIKEVFTNRFIKDLIFSGIFILCMYAIANNPMTRPMPQALPGNWSIQIMQHPLFFGFAGHNYIAIRNQDAEVVSEFHGLATDSHSGGWKYIGTKSTDVLKVWEFENGRYYLTGRNFPGKILAEGTSEEMLSLWGKARGCIEQINAKNVPYPPFGLRLKGETENSNSAAYTLGICMGLSPRHVGLLTPGDKVNLLKN